MKLQRDERFSILQSRDARVEFCYPNPQGRPLRLQLLDISVSGLRFRLSEQLPLLARGGVIEGVVVRVGECEMRGKLLIKHVTVEDSRKHCGAIFYPADESDLYKLNGVLAGISIQAV
jgi:hypothetical protein